MEGGRVVRRQGGKSARRRNGPRYLIEIAPRGAQTIWREYLASAGVEVVRSGRSSCVDRVSRPQRRRTRQARSRSPRQLRASTYRVSAKRRKALEDAYFSHRLDGHEPRVATQSLAGADAGRRMAFMVISLPRLIFFAAAVFRRKRVSASLGRRVPVLFHRRVLGARAMQHSVSLVKSAIAPGTRSVCRRSAPVR